MKMAKEAGNIYLNNLVLVNYLREEILVGTENVSEFVPKLHKIVQDYQGKSISDDANEVLEFYNKSKIVSEHKQKR